MRDFFRGDTTLLKLVFRDTQDLPVDITGWILYVTLKLDNDLLDNATSGVIQVKAELGVSDPQGLVYRNLNAVGGIVVIRIGPEKTSTLVGGETYKWDVQRSVTILNGDDELVDHDMTTLASGSVRVLADTTRTFRQGAIVVPD